MSSLGGRSNLTARWLVIAIRVLSARPAFSAGVDLSVSACPGNPGASGDAGTLDCADGQRLTLLVTFATSAASASLAGFHFQLVAVVDGDLTTNATFWDFDSANHAGWRPFKERPATGCPDFTEAMSGPSTSIYWGGLSHSANQVLLYVGCDRSSGVPIAAAERIFGAQVVIIVGTSLEAGGVTTGCSRSVCLSVPYAEALDAAGRPIGNSPLGSSAGFTNVVTINGALNANCVTVPVTRHTWGQLKSLYR